MPLRAQFPQESWHVFTHELLPRTTSDGQLKTNVPAIEGMVVEQAANEPFMGFVLDQRPKEAHLHGVG